MKLEKLICSLLLIRLQKSKYIRFRTTIIIKFYESIELTNEKKIKFKVQLLKHFNSWKVIEHPYVIEVFKQLCSALKKNVNYKY